MKKKLGKIILSSLKEGESKTAVFNKYKDLFEENTLRNILAHLPYPNYLRECRWRFIFLKLLWVQFVLLELIAVVQFIAEKQSTYLLSFAITISLCTHAFKPTVIGLTGGMIWFGWALLQFIRGYIVELEQVLPEDVVFYKIVFGYFMILCVTGIILMKNLKTKLFPNHGFLKPRRDSDGNVLYESLSVRQPDESEEVFSNENI